MKLTQKVDYFTVFKSFSSTSCCSQKLLPNNLEKIGWLDMRGSIRDDFIGWVAGDGLAGKGDSSKKGYSQPRHLPVPKATIRAFHTTVNSPLLQLASSRLTKV